MTAGIWQWVPSFISAVGCLFLCPDCDLFFWLLVFLCKGFVHNFYVWGFVCIHILLVWGFDSVMSLWPYTFGGKKVSSSIGKGIPPIRWIWISELNLWDPTYKVDLWTEPLSEHNSKVSTSLLVGSDFFRDLQFLEVQRVWAVNSSTLKWGLYLLQWRKSAEFFSGIGD